MFDAEIAAKLLNRGTSQASDECGVQYLDVLREGLLDFSHRIERLAVQDAGSEVPREIEWLIFRDGSRALRIRTDDVHTCWSEWVSIAKSGIVESVASANKYIETK
ncbi:hypothetical protein [Burkholderia contaminans]|uniref:hypothetical protein n=1 Tax=Burkholderia contaminans TaxID=488447 RepID=UPI00158D0808|nr:hypothetical protein [Burkholderia contaminans]ELK6462006.1 hypothetical protein [Burkholderia contaminans]MCA7889308.1 hypothetical protein [Burkholderia contaminans]